MNCEHKKKIEREDSIAYIPCSLYFFMSENLSSEKASGQNDHLCSTFCFSFVPYFMTTNEALTSKTFSWVCYIGVFMVTYFHGYGSVVFNQLISCFRDWRCMFFRMILCPTLCSEACFFMELSSSASSYSHQKLSTLSFFFPVIRAKLMTTF